jgi:hypothetical protein
MNEEGGQSFFVLVFIFLLVWGIFSLFSNKESEYEVYSKKSKDYINCSILEPSNSYSPGSGHYAGYEWSENNGGGYCGGNSASFNEGCEEFNSQQESYERCLSN